jgi:hypothetical protein
MNRSLWVPHFGPAKGTQYKIRPEWAIFTAEGPSHIAQKKLVQGCFSGLFPTALPDAGISASSARRHFSQRHTGIFFHDPAENLREGLFRERVESLRSQEIALRAVRLSGHLVGGMHWNPTCRERVPQMDPRGQQVIATCTDRVAVE